MQDPMITINILKVIYANSLFFAPGSSADVDEIIIS